MSGQDFVALIAAAGLAHSVLVVASLALLLWYLGRERSRKPGKIPALKADPGRGAERV